MADLTPEQVDAVLAHLSAEFDSAEREVRGRDYGFWNSNMSEQLGKAVADSKANELRALKAAAERHPERFAELATQAERDLRDLAGYSQEATVQAVLAATAQATAQQVKDDVNAAAGVVAKTVLGALPWWAFAAGGVALLGVGWFYLRPLIGRRA